MRNLLIILFVSLGLTAFSQRTITDTIIGTETVSFTTMSGAQMIQAVTTTMGSGDTTSGTLALYGSLDGTNFSFLNFLGGVTGISSPKASITGAELNQITITEGLVSSFEILKQNFPYYKIVGVGGTGNDSTLVVIKWSK